MPDLWNFGPFLTPWWQFWSKWYKKIILDVSHRDQTEVQWDPTKARNAWFAAFWSTFDAHAPSGANWLKPKSHIEKRKMEYVERNLEICLLVREENENFCKKKCDKSAIISLVWRREGEILQIFSSFEKRNLKRFSPVSSGERLFSHHTGAYPSYKILCHDTLFHIWRQDS